MRYPFIVWQGKAPGIDSELRVVLDSSGAIVEQYHPDAMGENGWHRTKSDLLVRGALHGMAIASAENMRLRGGKS